MIVIFGIFLLTLLVITAIAIVRTENLFVAVMLMGIASLLIAANFFLLDAADRARYLAVMDQALASDGQAVIATFGPDGPLKCSGLDTVRYSAGELAAELCSRWRLVEQRAEAHRTPLGREQHFGYGRFARAAMRGAETR